MCPEVAVPWMAVPFRKPTYPTKIETNKKLTALGGRQTPRPPRCLESGRKSPVLFIDCDLGQGVAARALLVIATRFRGEHMPWRILKKELRYLHGGRRG